MEILQAILIFLMLSIGLYASGGSINCGTADDDPFYVVVGILNALSIFFLLISYCKAYLI